MHTRFARHLNFVRPDFSDVEPDMRRAVRRSVSLPCETTVQGGSASTALRMTVLSPFGAWIETPQPLAAGLSLRVAFAIAGADGVTLDLDLAARVTWTALPGELDASDPGGMGLAFETTDVERAQIDAALAGCAPAPATGVAASADDSVLWSELSAVDAAARDALAFVAAPAATVAEGEAEAEAAVLQDLDSWFLETRPATPTETTEVLRLSPVAPRAPRVVEEPRWVRASNGARVSLSLTSY